jgi:hypothetical protein
MLHSGATDSGRAGGHAQTGRDRLAAAPQVAGMFGDFGAAHAFHETVIESHSHHVETLGRHREFLGGIGQQAHHAATDFTAMENRNAAVMHEVDREVRWT